MIVDRVGCCGLREERKAGVCNGERNVFGLMPHPEHAVEELVGGSADGLCIFRSMRDALEPAVA